MTRQPIQLDPFQGVGSGQRATLQISPGLRYHQLALSIQTTDAGGTLQTMNQTNMSNAISLVELMIGTKVQRTYTPAELFMISQFLGYTVRNGFMHIYFSERDRNTVFGEEALAWGTGNLEDPAFTARVTFASGIYNPVLKAYAERDNVVGADGKPLPIGAIVKTYETVLNPTGSGWYTWKPDISRGDKIRRVHLKDNGHCTAVQVFANGNLEYDADAAYNSERISDANFTPQSNYFHTIHDIDHSALSNMDVVRAGALLNSLQYKYNFDASGSYTALVEVIGPPD